MLQRQQRKTIAQSPPVMGADGRGRGRAKPKPVAKGKTRAKTRGRGSSASVASMLPVELPPAAGPWKEIFDEKVVPASKSDDLATLESALADYIGALSADDLGVVWSDAKSCIDVLQVLGKIAMKLQDDKASLENEVTPASAIAAQICNILSTAKAAIDIGVSSHVRRVVGGHGWALHGLAFELQNGTRLGQFLQNNGAEMDLLGDMALKERGGRWQNLTSGEYIVEASGYHCKAGYLAYGIDLKTNKGRTITYSSNHTDWRGGRFSFKAGSRKQIEVVNFSRGRCTGVGCVPVLDWGDKKEDVGNAFDIVAVPVLTAFALANACKEASAKKYALFTVESLGYGSLECLQALKHQLCDSMEVPSYWDRSVMQGIELADDAGIRFDSDDRKNIWGKVVLDAQNLTVLQTLFDASFRKRYTRDRKGAQVPDGVKLVKGYRVQNAMNWAEFVKAAGTIKADLATLKRDGAKVMTSVENLKTAGVLPAQPKFDLDAEANCAWLFHGTNDAAADCISKGDFRIDQAGSNAGTLFGRGVYLAESCSKSDEYSQENGVGLRCMLVCRAILGNINYCDEKHPNGDALVRSCVSGPYHSVLGDREKIHYTFREFIVYDHDLVYPEYVVWYRRVYGHLKLELWIQNKQ